MSTSPDFDLEKLFLPSWAQESPTANRYEHHPGERESDRERSFGDRRGLRRDGPPRRDGGGRPGGPGSGPSRGPRPAGAGAAGGPPRSGGPGGGMGGGPRRSGGPRRDDRGGDRGGDRGQGDRREDRPAPQPLPELNVTIMPDEKGVESLSRQIKMSGRSFPLFDIAKMILQKPERQQVRFESRKKADGTVAQYLYLCAVDDTLWLSEQEVVDYLMSKHFGLFYQTEKIPTDPPKGTYTFVAQCGMSGVILGPPNHHDYQNQLHRLHQERFSRIPFDMYKSRVKIVREEAVVKQWVEEQSFKTEYIGLNLPEPIRFANREAVMAHFKEVHQPNIIKAVEKHMMSGPASKTVRSQGLQRLLRIAWDEQRRFPLQIATILSQQFAGHGLQFFKVNKTITHVSVARPHYLDIEATPVSDQVKMIVDFINAHSKCTRRTLVEAMAPTPAAAPIQVHTEPAAPVAEGETPAEAPAPAAAPAPTPEQASLIGDLHWLIHQGHVIEFANGLLETAKKPAPRPVRPPKAPKEKVENAAQPAEAAAVSDTAAPAEVSAAPAVEAAAEGAEAVPDLSHEASAHGTEPAAHEEQASEAPHDDAPPAAR